MPKNQQPELNNMFNNSAEPHDGLSNTLFQFNANSFTKQAFKATTGNDNSDLDLLTIALPNTDDLAEPKLNINTAPNSFATQNANFFNQNHTASNHSSIWSFPTSDNQQQRQNRQL